jgi:hypothetical protein
MIKKFKHFLLENSEEDIKLTNVLKGLENEYLQASKRMMGVYYLLQETDTAIKIANLQEIPMKDKIFWSGKKVFKYNWFDVTYNKSDIKWRKHDYSDKLVIVEIPYRIFKDGLKIQKLNPEKYKRYPFQDMQPEWQEYINEFKKIYNL